MKSRLRLANFSIGVMLLLMFSTELSIHDLLIIMSESGEAERMVKISNVEVIEKLTSVDGKTYIGKLSAAVKQNGQQSTAICSMVLSKRTKVFGNEKQEVWEVSLGRMDLELSI